MLFNVSYLKKRSAYMKYLASYLPYEGKHLEFSPNYIHDIHRNLYIDIKVPKYYIEDSEKEYAYLILEHFVMEALRGFAMAYDERGDNRDTLPQTEEEFLHLILLHYMKKHNLNNKLCGEEFIIHASRQVKESVFEGKGIIKDHIITEISYDKTEFCKVFDKLCALLAIYAHKHKAIPDYVLDGILKNADSDKIVYVE